MDKEQRMADATIKTENPFSFTPHFYTNADLASCPTAEARQQMLDSNEFHFTKMNREIAADLAEVKARTPSTPEYKARQAQWAEMNDFKRSMNALMRSFTRCVNNS